MKEMKNSRLSYRLQNENSKVRTYEIGELDIPRTHTELWCDRRICEGFWGNEDCVKFFVDTINNFNNKFSPSLESIKLVNDINKSNEIKYGKLCECGMFESFCGCKDLKN